MAYDLSTGKVSGRDWSLGDVSDETSVKGEGEGLGKKIAPLLTIGAVGLGVWVISHQPSARQIQESHLQAWHRKNA